MAEDATSFKMQKLNASPWEGAPRVCLEAVLGREADHLVRLFVSQAFTTPTSARGGELTEVSPFFRLPSPPFSKVRAAEVITTTTRINYPLFAVTENPGEGAFSWLKSPNGS